MIYIILAFKLTVVWKVYVTKFVFFVKIAELCTHYAISISYKHIRSTPEGSCNRYSCISPDGPGRSALRSAHTQQRQMVRFRDRHRCLCQRFHIRPYNGSWNVFRHGLHQQFPLSVHIADFCKYRPHDIRNLFVQKQPDEESSRKQPWHQGLSHPQLHHGIPRHILQSSHHNAHDGTLRPVCIHNPQPSSRDVCRIYRHYRRCDAVVVWIDMARRQDPCGFRHQRHSDNQQGGGQHRHSDVYHRPHRHGVQPLHPANDKLLTTFNNLINICSYLRN